MTTEQANYQWAKSLAFEQGAILFGVAEISRIRSHFLLSPEESEAVQFGISIAVPISPAVLLGIHDGPTLLYKWHYRQANNFLDKIAFLLTTRIIEKGFYAIPIPASQIVDYQNQRGHLSHREVAVMAGLGWRGKNNLVVHPQWGSAFRLVTILTNFPLVTDSPMQGGCGACRACVEKCPASALGETPEAYRLDLCYALLDRFSKERKLGVHICGICVKACYFRNKNHL